MSVVAVVMVLVASACALVSWRTPPESRGHSVLVAVMTGCLLVVGGLVLGAGPHDWGAAASAVLLVLLALLAVAGGGPLAVVALALADDRRAPVAEPLDDGEVLRGGAWIGALERAGIYATLAAGWPEGMAVVLAVKGVGRYHELGAQGAAERFIIGTFASVLWAAACAGLWWFG